MLVTSPTLPTRPLAATRPQGYEAATVELEDRPLEADTHYSDGTPRSDLSYSAQVSSRSQPTSPLGRVVASVMLGGGLWTAANIASQVASSGPAGVALAAGALVAGYAAADLSSGIFHHWVDNYPTPETPVVGKMAKEFQEHHFRTYDLLELSFLDNCVNAGRFLAPVMGLVAVANPHYAVAASALAFLTGGYLAQGSHRWTHMQNPPRIGRLLQNLGLAQSKKSHAMHHRMPWSDHYCIVNGMWNPLLSKTDFWRKLENVYYRASGVEPKSWRDPGVKQLALGQISKEEFLAHQKETRKAFSEVISDERKYWREQDQVRRQELAAAPRPSGTLTGMLAGLTLLGATALPVDDSLAAPPSAVPVTAVQAYDNLTGEQKQEVASQLSGTTEVLWLKVENRRAFIDGSVGPINVFEHLRGKLEERRDSGEISQDSFRRLSAALGEAEKLTALQRAALVEKVAPEH